MVTATLNDFRNLSKAADVPAPRRKPNAIELHLLKRTLEDAGVLAEGRFPLREVFRHSSARFDGITYGLSVVDCLRPEERIAAYHKAQKILFLLADEMLALFEKAFPSRNFARDLLETSRQYRGKQIVASTLDNSRWDARKEEMLISHNLINGPRYALDVVFLASHAALCGPARLLQAIHLYLYAMECEGRSMAHYVAGLYQNSMHPAPDAAAKGEAARQKGLETCQRLLVNHF